MAKITWFCMISFSCQCIFAQHDTLTLRSYAVSYEEKMTASFTYQHSSNTFFMAYEDAAATYKAQFIPNTKQRLVAGLSYKFIDVSIGFTPNFMKTDASKLASNNFNLGLRFNYKKWYQSLTFINQKGFFVDYNEYERFYLPRLRSTKIGGTASYVFNEKFSYKTLFNQNQWQRKSAGSFVPNIAIYYTNITSKEQAATFHVDIYTFSVAPSYHYNWVISQNFLVSAGLLIGAGINIVDKEAAALYEVAANIKLGYNNDSFFTYLGINSTSFFQQEKATQFYDSFADVKLSLGYRFNPPKKFKKFYDTTVKKVGF